VLSREASILTVNEMLVSARIPAHAFLDIEEPAKQESALFLIKMVVSQARYAVHHVFFSFRPISQASKSVFNIDAANLGSALYFLGFQKPQASVKFLEPVSL
jgi:hypothetical protein